MDWLSWVWFGVMVLGAVFTYLAKRIIPIVTKNPEVDETTLFRAKVAGLVIVMLGAIALFLR